MVPKVELIELVVMNEELVSLVVDIVSFMLFVGNLMYRALML